MPYLGNSPQNNVRQRYYYVATAGQTVFSGADTNGISLKYQDGKYLDVYLNGILLQDTEDYTALTKTSVTLLTGAGSGDLIEIVAYGVFSVADTVSASRGGTFTGDVAFTGNLTTTGTITGTSANLSGNLVTTGSISAASGSLSGNLDVAGTVTAASANLSGNLVTTGSITAASGSLSGNFNVTGTVSMGSSFMRNRIINGAMDIWQRGTSFTPGNQYTADRWYSNRNGGVAGVTFSQSYGAFGSNKNWMSVHRANGNSASNEAVIYQPIEGINSRDLAGQTVTMSFTVCTGSTLSVTTNNIYFALGYQTTTTDIGLAGSWSTVGTSAISVPSNTGPTRYSVQFSVPSNATQLLPYVRFQFSGTASSDDRYYITEIQLEPGNVVTPFERRLYGQEFELCRRYCRVIQATTAYSYLGPIAYFEGPGTLQQPHYIAGMRSPGTVSLTASGTIQGEALGGNLTLNGIGLHSTDWARVHWNVTNTGTVGQSTAIRSNNDINTKLVFSNEL